MERKWRWNKRQEKRGSNNHYFCPKPIHNMDSKYL